MLIELAVDANVEELVSQVRLARGQWSRVLSEMDHRSKLQGGDRASNYNEILLPSTLAHDLVAARGRKLSKWTSFRAAIGRKAQPAATLAQSEPPLQLPSPLPAHPTPIKSPL